MKRGVILKEDDLREVVEYFITKDRFVFDVEAQGENRGVPHLANLSWMSLATDGVAVTIPFGHPIGNKIVGERPEYHKYKTGKKIGETYTRMVPVYEDPPPQIEIGTVFQILKPLFWKPGIIKSGHNLIYDLVAVPKYFGEIPPPPYSDTITKQWLLDENMLRKDLKTLTKLYWHADYDTDGAGKQIEAVPFDDACYYTYCDAVYDYLLDIKLDAEIDAEGLRDVFDLEMGVLGALIKMNMHGARVDIPRLEQLQVDLGKQVEEAEAQVYKAAGKRFNINSNPQKQSILYGPKSEGGQGLKPWKLTKAGKKKINPDIHDYSTDADVLASYPGNSVTNALKDYQDVSKILNTYVTGWLGDGDTKSSLIYNGHIHADFVQYGTVTGRFSCREPNLQNIPRPSSDLGKLVRGAFVPEEGGKLVVADYAQIELVILAHYIGQGKLYEAFLTGIDPHTMTAAMVLGKDPSDVTKIERQDLGKTLGFAVVYGAGLNKVASMANISVQEAKRVLATHKKMFPEIHAFKDEVIKITKSRKPPYLTTLLGRKRRIQGLYSSDEGFRMGAERQAFNSLIQGGAADLIKLAMTRVDATLPPEVQLILTVHDELVLASPADMAEEAAALLQEAMTGPEIQALVKVPLLAEVKIVDRWNEAK